MVSTNCLWPTKTSVDAWYSSYQNGDAHLSWQMASRQWMNYSSAKRWNHIFWKWFVDSGHDVAKTKYVHQVTTSTLCRLMTSAFEHSKEEGYTLDFVEWHASNELGNPQFQFWSVAMKMKVDYVLFLWSIKSSNFKFYVEPNGKFLP